MKNESTKISRSPRNPKRNSARGGIVLYTILAGAAAIVIAMLYAAAPLRADTPPPGGDPMANVKGVMDQTIAVFKDRQISAADRQRQLRTIAEAHFDFGGMARSAVGYHWKSLSDDQRKEFVPLFTNFLEDVALTQIEQYSVQKVQQEIQTSVILFDRELVSSDGAEVFSTVSVQGQDKPLKVNYMMTLVDGQWRIYDINVDAISVIANYRNQFNRVLNQQGYDKLISLIKQKSEQLGSTLAS
ncbi:MAG: phospholipid-binding protein MlaC [Candidatus Binataceae bacterium]